MSQRNKHSTDKSGTAASKSNTFFGGAAILAIGIMAVKLIGMFYKIPLINIIGEEGAADFSNAYNIYSVLLTISTAGLPIAVSKMVSEANALGRKNQVNRVFRVALLVFLTLSIASFLLMNFFSYQLAELMNDTLAAPGIRALAPAVICVGCLSAFRGYTQGHQNMAPTAISQILEAVVKLVLGLFLASYVMKLTFDVSDLARYRPELDTSQMTAEEIARAVTATQTSQAAAGAITGVTVGTILALAFMVAYYFFGKMRNREVGRDRPDSASSIMKSLLTIAIPITLTASMSGIVTVIDASLVQGQLQKLYMRLNDIAVMTAENQEVIEQYSRTLYGNYAGALNIYNLPLSLMVALTASVIPAVSSARALHDKARATRIIGSAFRMAALISFPMGAGLMALGTPIIGLLFPSLNQEIAGPLLSMLGFASIFVCLVSICHSVLQAYGFVNLPVVIMTMGGIVKIVTNYNLVPIESIAIRGAPVGTILCFGLCLALDLAVIARVIPNRPRYGPLFIKPALAAAIMGFGAWAVYGLCAKAVIGIDRFTVITDGVTVLSRTGNGICTLFAIAVAVVLYCVLVVVLGAITRDDLNLMPKGDRIAKILRLKR